ncbi:MAG: MCE family protein [Actinobacteria bacterium]|nr:MCE family protein [Actinomycetota bacterium]
MNINRMMLIKVLVFSTIAAILTVLLGVKLANSRLFADTYVMQAEFEDATGVLIGDSVKLAGVDIGRVEKAEIQDGKAVVTFNLDKTVELPKDSTVALRWRNVLGQRFLYVYPGDDEEVFVEGQRIPLDQTEDVSDIGEFLNRLGPVLKAIDPEQANAFLDSVNTALTGNEQDVRQLIDDGAELAATLGGEDENIKGLLSSTDQVMEAFASQDEALGQIFDDLDEVGGVLSRRTADINSLVTDFAVVQRQLNGLAVRNADNIDSTLRDLETVADVLADNREQLGYTLRTLPLGLAGYFQTSSWGEWFNVRITSLQFRDTESNIVAREDEAENQRGTKGGSPDVGHGAGDGYEKDADGDDRDPRTSRRQKDRDDQNRRHAEGAVGIESVLRFVLMGDAR